MSRLTLVLLLTSCSGPVALSGGRMLPSALAVSPVDLAGQPTPTAPVSPTHFTLQSGLDVFLVTEPADPFVSIDVVIGCGRVDDPPGLAGLTDLMLYGLVRMGAGDLDSTAQALAQTRLGGFRLRLGDGESEVSLVTRASDFERAVAHLATVLRSPRYESAALALAQEQELSRQSGPEHAHARLVERVRLTSLFGPSSRLSAVASPETVRSLRREQVLDQYARCVRPRSVTLAIAGGVDAQAVRAALRRFEDWAGAEVPPRALRDAPPSPRRIFVVPSASSKVVTVTIAGPGLPPGTDQRAAAQVFSSILSGLLMSTLRSELGAVYGADAEVEVGPTRGVTRLSFTTRRELARVAVQKSLELLDWLWQRWPFSDDNLKPISASVADWWRLQSSRTLALDAARAQRQGGGTSVAERIDAVKMEDLRQLFVATLKPSQVQIIVSGAVPGDVSWSDFAPVTRVTDAEAHAAGCCRNRSPNTDSAGE